MDSMAAVKTNTPVFSVIVPVYNVEAYLERCVDSLLNQTLEELEILLIDDGSKDKSGVICDEYASRDSRVKVLHKENEGQGIARNKGLQMASGSYVCFIDSDDYIVSETLEKLKGLMDKGADMVSFGYQIDSPLGECVTVPLIRDNEYNESEITDSFLLHFFGDDPKDSELRGFSSCMSSFRMEIIRENDIHFPSERVVLSEDTVFCLNYLKYAKKVITVSEVFYHYCQKADSFSQGYRPDRMEKTLDMLSILKDKADEFGILDRVATRLSMYVWVSLMANLKQEVRRKGSVPAKEINNNIKALCNNTEIVTLVSRLKNAGLPMKQKVFLWAFLNKRIALVRLLCELRAGKRI